MGVTGVTDMTPDSEPSSWQLLAAACAALGAVIGMEYPNLPCRLLDLARDGTLATADREAGLRALAGPAGKARFSLTSVIECDGRPAAEFEGVYAVLRRRGQG
jgi:hypothetical protein